MLSNKNASVPKDFRQLNFVNSYVILNNSLTNSYFSLKFSFSMSCLLWFFDLK